MDLWTELAASLRLVLTLVVSKEKTKYADQLHQMTEERDNELQKPVYEGPSGEIPKDLRNDYRDHRILDDLDRRLHNLSITIRTAVGTANPVLQ